MDKFVHLHRHSDLSFLDGTGSAIEYAQRCADIGQSALAITDHGNLCGVIGHVQACYQHEILPIIGMEAYFKPDRTVQNKENKTANHTTMWALDLEGWHNLIKLSSESHRTGFYYRPCADWDLFSQYNKGLAVSTGCMAGPIPRAVLSGDDKMVKESCDKLSKYFGDNVFVEIMPHDIDDLKKLNIEMIKIANERGWPIIATLDAHYPTKDWASTQDIMLMISTGQTAKKRREAEEKGEDVYKFDIDTLYLTERQEVELLFKAHHPEITDSLVQQACDNTFEIVNRLKPFVIDKSDKTPKVKLSKPTIEIIKDWCSKGLADIGKTSDKSYEDRLAYELNILIDKDVVDYFYLVGDLVKWAKAEGIRVGVGRGSAAGSLVSYLIGITNIDPISYGLLFERFLNPTRLSMPDIDLDFQHDRREEVKKYLSDKWGSDHVIDISAYQTFKAKSSIKDVARVLDVSLDEVMPLMKKLDEFNPSDPLVEIREKSTRLNSFADKNPEVWEHAIRLQGKIKALSKHPAGVVVTDRPITDYMPAMRGKHGDMVTQWSETLGVNAVTDYGFLKIDVLATDGLTKQERTLQLVEQRTGERPDIDRLEVFQDSNAVHDDVMQAWCKGDTLGVFQFESPKLAQLIKQIQPTSLEDIAAANALYRPGPLQGDMTYRYGRRKNGREEITYWHNSLKPYMEKTYGLLVYQEQVINIVKDLGGFSSGQADNIRKAITKWIGKKGEKYLRQYKDQFVQGSSEHGIDKELAEDIWGKLTQFASYAFNASHSTGYAAQAYQDMYLKTKYPIEFYTSLMSQDQDKIASAAREAKYKGIKVLPPDINVSDESFVIDGDNIRFGLTAIKNVGQAAVKEIAFVRQDGGPFKSYDDFCERINQRKCNKKVKESLINAGAFDCFDMRSEWSEEDIIEKEVELLGMGLTVDSINEEQLALIEKFSNSNDEFLDAKENTSVVIGGEIINYDKIRTKRGQDMSRLVIDYKGLSYSVIVFPAVHVKYSEVLRAGEVIMVKGIKDDQGGMKASIISTVDYLIEAENG